MCNYVICVSVVSSFSFRNLTIDSRVKHESRDAYWWIKGAVVGLLYTFTQVGPGKKLCAKVATNLSSDTSG